MKNLRKQRGMGLWDTLLIILVCVFIGKFAFAVIPMYTENRYITTGLKELAATSGKSLQKMTDSEIRRNMEDFYMINNVTSEESKKIVIERKSGGLVVKVDYEARANFFANIDLVLRFANHLDAELPDLCCKPRVEPPSAKY